MSINLDTLHELLGKAVVDFGATFHAALVRVGDKLGLYKALAAGGPQTPAELAKRTATTERYVREWLCNQAAGGYVTYDAETGKFHLSEEQAFAMADENSPAFLPGMFQTALAAIKAEEQITERFKTGEGLGWHQHHQDLFVGTERFFRPGYAANLVSSWIPALQGVKEKLEQGAKVADIGCGLGVYRTIRCRRSRRRPCRLRSRHGRRAHGPATALFTMNLDLIAQMSCNPAIGGIAKGHLVREVDALGGIMGEVADAVGIQFRLLNTSRGPAVWSPAPSATSSSTA
jgi:hypothetical protein